MPQMVGVRELKNQASRVIRQVSEEMVEYVVTLRGEPVALLRPLTKEEVQRLRQAEVDESLDEMKALAQQVADAWISDKSGVQLVADQRR